MRKLPSLILISLSLLLVIAGVIWLLQRPGAPIITAGTPSTAEEVRRVEADELHAQLAAPNPPLVWEFRSPETYAQGHIPGSRLMTLDGIPDAAAKLDKLQAIVALCT